jgi:hypothetical protein
MLVRGCIELCGKHHKNLDIAKEVGIGSGAEIDCPLGTSGSMRIAAFKLWTQVCQKPPFAGEADWKGRAAFGTLLRAGWGEVRGSAKAQGRSIAS